jgi:CDP-glycerol glycerophosphotransferase (TagB/SpsB family)
VTWFSLPYEIPRTIDASLNFEEAPSQAFLDLIEGKKDTYERVWYILTDDTPSYALQDELRYLDTHFPIDNSVRIIGRTTIKVRLYSFDG